MKKAYTIIELTIVITIVAILSAATIILVSNAINSMQLSAAADKVVSDIRFAQNSASSQGKWTGVIFSISPTNSYTVYSTDGTTDTAFASPTKSGSLFVIDLNADFSVSISAVNISSGNKVEFNPLGTPYKDKTGIPIAADGTITISKGTTNKIIHIVPNIGRLYVQ